MNPANRNIWRRLRRNKGVLFGLFIIAAAMLVALSAYYIAPDPSPDANRIIVEIGGRKPGFRQLFLLLPKDRQPDPVGFFRRLISGREDAFNYIPITGYTLQG